MFSENTYQINPGLQIFRKKKCLTFLCSDSYNNRNLQKFISEFWSINIYYGNHISFWIRQMGVWILVPQLTSFWHWRRFMTFMYYDFLIHKRKIIPCIKLVRSKWGIGMWSNQFIVLVMFSVDDSSNSFCIEGKMK